MVTTKAIKHQAKKARKTVTAARAIDVVAVQS